MTIDFVIVEVYPFYSKHVIFREEEVLKLTKRGESVVTALENKAGEGFIFISWEHF